MINLINTRGMHLQFYYTRTENAFHLCIPFICCLSLYNVV